jgi:hypothetical protein
MLLLLLGFCPQFRGHIAMKYTSWFSLLTSDSQRQRDETLKVL